MELTKEIIQMKSGYLNFKSSENIDRTLSMSIIAELTNLGYMPTNELISNILTADVHDLSEFHSKTLKNVAYMLGAGEKYVPLYPGFPKQVMDMYETELFINQILHYISNGTFMPVSDDTYKHDVFETPITKQLDICTNQEFNQIFTDIVSVNKSLPKIDIGIIEWFINTKHEIILPDTIPFKETLCLLAVHGLNVPVKTVTDVMRIAVKLSGGDISLPNVIHNDKSFRFKKFNRADRLYLLSLLEKTNLDASDAIPKKARWIRLGEIIHPGDYEIQFPDSYEFFRKLRNDKIKTWNSRLADSFHWSYEAGLNMLKDRPGVFVRKVDHLIRSSVDKKVNLNLIYKYAEMAFSKASNKTLIELYLHFSKRDVEYKRSVMIGQSRVPYNLPSHKPLPICIIKKITDIILNAIMSKYKELDDMGKVYIDDELKNIPVPGKLNNISNSMIPKIRGQRTKVIIPEDGVIRAFVHWYDNNGNEDLDLSGTFIGDGKMTNVSYNTSMKTEFATHSGDVRFKIGPCAEYIDININECINHGYKYVVFDVNNYTDRALKTVQDPIAGYMQRGDMFSDTFKASTVSDAIYLASDNSSTIISMLDLSEMVSIYLDIDHNDIPVTSLNKDNILNTIEPYISRPKLSAHDIINMHVKSRNGLLVYNKEDADIVYEFDTFKNSYTELLKLI